MNRAETSSMDENTPALGPTFTRNQRIVLEHTAGPYAGLFQIKGHSDEFEGRQPPALTDVFEIQPGQRLGVASLVKSTPRYVLYRELTRPAGLGIFDQRQQ